MFRALFSFCLMACSTIAAAGPNTDADADFTARFGDRFLEAWWPLHPDAAIAAGYYRIADRLIVPDAEARATEKKFLEDWLAKLHEIKPDSLNPANRTDWALIDNQLRSDLWALDEQRAWEWNPASYNVADAFALLLNTEYAPLDRRLRTVLTRLAKVPAYYAAALASVHNPSHEHTRLAIEQNRGALDVFGADLEKQLASSKLSPDERTLFKQRTAAAREAIQKYVSGLEALDKENAGARSFRLGRELYDKKFAFANPGGETAEELYQSAQKERNDVLDKMNALADRLWAKTMGSAAKPADRNAKIAAVIDKISEQHVAPNQYVGYVRDLIPRLEQFVTDRHLITLDKTKPLVVRDTPAYERGVSIASIESPGPYDPTARTYFNVLPLDTLPAAEAESFLREYNSWLSQVFIIHEAVPGHYVQLIYSNRSPSRIKSIFGNGATVEGWAVYTERMMLESGWGANAPELWLMYWKWYLRSVTNTVLDYAVHAQNLDEAQALHMLTHEAFQSQKEATGKWRRVQLSSVQLTSYYSGFSQIYAFRQRMQRLEGSRFNLQRFHERFLGYGSAPVPVIAELMTGNCGACNAHEKSKL